MKVKQVVYEVFTVELLYVVGGRRYVLDVKKYSVFGE